MKMNLYTIYDTVAKENGPVFEAKNDGTASRSFISFLTSNKTVFAEEYHLIRVGRIDKESNLISDNQSERILLTNEGTDNE